MKLIKISTLALTGFFSLSALANVELLADPHLDLLVINGQRPEVTSTLFSSTQKATLPNGENQIVFRYTYAYTRGKNYESTDSHVIVAKFNAADTKLQFNFPEFKNIRDAEKHMDSLNWSLIDTRSNRTVKVAEDKLLKEGLQIGRDYVQETENYNIAGGPAAVTSKREHLIAASIAERSAKTAATPVQVSEPTTAQSNANTAEEMLYFWYQKADAETQARFKAYINQ